MRAGEVSLQVQSRVCRAGWRRAGSGSRDREQHRGLHLLGPHLPPHEYLVTTVGMWTSADFFG